MSTALVAYRGARRASSLYRQASPAFRKYGPRAFRAARRIGRAYRGYRGRKRARGGARLSLRKEIRRPFKRYKVQDTSTLLPGTFTSFILGDGLDRGTDLNERTSQQIKIRGMHFQWRFNNGSTAEQFFFRFHVVRVMDTDTITNRVFKDAESAQGTDYSTGVADNFRFLNPLNNKRFKTIYTKRFKIKKKNSEDGSDFMLWSELAKRSITINMNEDSTTNDQHQYKPLYVVMYWIENESNDELTGCPFKMISTYYYDKN